MAFFLALICTAGGFITALSVFFIFDTTLLQAIALWMAISVIGMFLALLLRW